MVDFLEKFRKIPQNSVDFIWEIILPLLTEMGEIRTQFEFSGRNPRCFTTLHVHLCCLDQAWTRVVLPSPNKPHSGLTFSENALGAFE
jgi:hypothetical protein